MKNTIRLLLVTVALVLAGCAHQAPQVTEAPQPLEAASRQLAVNLFRQVHEREYVINKILPTEVVIDPFIDANTAEVTETSKRIESLLMDEASKNYTKLRFQPFSPENVNQAKYLLVGVIKLDNYSQGGNTKHYKLSSSLIELKSGKVVANSSAWISDKKLDSTPSAIYQGSPMYLKDKRADGLVETAQTQPGVQANQDYFSTLSTAALLNEGDKAFEQKNYDQALIWYKQAELRSDGQLMKTYAGLYQVYRKLGKTNETEVAFGRLVAAGFNHKTISIKLMFSVASTDFINDPDLRSQYTMWLRQIAQQVKRTETCLHISGHSSRTGGEAFNENLSLQRAIFVQKTIQKDFAQIPQRSTVFGRGWKDNIIGTGSDDMQDAIDRRVEFKIVDCR